MNVTTFLNTPKTASEDYELVPHHVKNDINNMLVLNIDVAAGKVASAKLNLLFEEFVNHPIVPNGGAEPFFTELRTIYQAIRNIRIPWATASV